jgi:parvulin-like peptidyl-prolyl isomerase
LAKKQKKVEPERIPTKHQRSKWQRQMRIRRIVIAAAIVFLVGIGGWVGYQSYADHQAKVGPLREVMFDVNGVKLDMQYYINNIAAYASIYGWNSSLVSAYGNEVADMVADNIINTELLKQGAAHLGITVNSTELDAALRDYQWPNNTVYQDILRGVLLNQKVNDYFGSNPPLPATMMQADVQVVLVESQKAATDLVAQASAPGANFTALLNSFSCNSTIKGDLGWLPKELMPNAVIADAAFNGTAGEISEPVFDKSAIKDRGYWVIEVTAKEGNQINVRAMLLGSEVQAEQVKAELAAGGNFSSLAAEYSQYQGSNSTGELGWKKKGDMGSAAFDAVAFSLPLDQVSDPVKDTSARTTGGYWVVNVVDRGLHALSDDVRQQLITKRYSDWLQSWTHQSTINTYLDPAKKTYAINQVLARMAAAGI